MTHAKNVGRVGALAVALGVGWAVALSPGVALAQTDGDSGQSTTSDTGSSKQRDDSGSDGARTDDRTSEDSGDDDDDDDDSDDTDDDSDDTDDDDTDGDDTVTDPESGESLTSGNETSTPPTGAPNGGADEEPQEPGGSDMASGGDGAPVPDPVVVPVAESPTPGPVRETPTDRPAGETPTLAPPADAVTPTARSTPQPAPGAAPTERHVGVSALSDAPQAPAAEARTFAVTTAAPTPAPMVAPAPTPVLAGLPGVFVNVAGGLLTVALSPFLVPGPAAPTAPPTLFAVLAWVRREIQQTFFNRAPVVSYRPDDMSQNAEGVVTGKVTVTDPDGDPVALTASNGAKGTVVLNQDGTFTYTPSSRPTTAYEDEFTVTAVSTGGGLHLQDVASALSRFDILGALHALVTPPTTRRTIKVLVGVPNRVPTAGNVTASTNEDTAATIDVRPNVSDADGNPVTVALGTGPKSGTVTLTGGVFTYTPNKDFNGTDSFTYTAGDGTLTSAPATVTVRVAPVNDAPTAVADSFTTREDKPVTFTLADLQRNDYDVDGDRLEPDGANLDLSTLRGDFEVTVEQGVGVVITYTPPPNFVGTETLYYSVFDESGAESNVAAITITVTAEDDPPVAVGDTITGAVEDTPFTFDAGQLTGNDTDADGDPRTIESFTQPANGTLTLTDGTFTYVPKANFNGTDTFTYTLAGGSGATATATVAVTVAAVDDAPIATPRQLTVNEDLLLRGLLRGSDAEGGVLTYALREGTRSGTVTVNPDGSFTYLPSRDFHGTDSFSFTVTDAGGNVSEAATVTIVVNPVNDPPVAGPTLTLPMQWGQPVTISRETLLAGASDVEGDPLVVEVASNPLRGTVTDNGDGTFTYTQRPGEPLTDVVYFRVSDGVASVERLVILQAVLTPRSQPDTYQVAEDSPLTGNVLANDDLAVVEGVTTTVGVVEGPRNGTLTLNPDGSFTYTPKSDYHGGDSFTYVATTGTDAGAATAVTITITPVNAAPVANGETLTGAVEDKPFTFTAAQLLANDTDADTDRSLLTIASFTQPNNGTLTYDSTTGQFTYTPRANFNGRDSFGYRISDGTSISNAIGVVIGVEAVNDAPVGGIDTLTASSDTPTTITVEQLLGNDTDVEGETVSFVRINQPANGTLTRVGNDYVYRSRFGFTGTDTFTYVVTDSRNAQTVVTANVVVQPTVKPDSYTVNEDEGVVIRPADLLANDSGMTMVTTFGRPQHGYLVASTGGNVIYRGTQDFHGVDSFTYTAVDAAGNPQTGTVTITVRPIEDPPVARPDTVSVDEDGTLRIAADQLLANDFDPEGAAPTIRTVTNGANGTATLNTDGSVTYTPNRNFHGTDTFTYTVSDGRLESAPATVTVRVNPVNDPPVSTDDAVTVRQGQTVVIRVLDNDSDIDGDALRLDSGLWKQPEYGTASVTDNGTTITYTAPSDWSGQTVLQYVPLDNKPGDMLFGHQGRITTVTITVVADNRAPTGTVEVAAPQQGSGDVLLTLTTSDPDGDAVTVTPSASRGTIQLVSRTGNVATYRYTPGGQARVDAYGTAGATDTVRFDLSDGKTTGQATASVSVSQAAAAVVDTIAVGQAPVGAVAYGGRLYVTNRDSGTVSVIDTATRTVLGALHVGPEPEGIAVARDKIYVANSGNGTVSVINPTRGHAVTTITGVGSMPFGLTAAGDQVFVTDSAGGQVMVIETSTDTLRDYDRNQPGAQGMVLSGGIPTGVAVRRDSFGNAITYVNDFDNGRVIVLNASGAPVSVINVGREPEGSALVGTTLFVAVSGEGKVAIVDTTANRVGGTIAVGGSPRRIVDAGPVLAVSLWGSDTVTLIDKTTLKVIDVDPSTPGVQSVPVGGSPVALAYEPTPTGLRLYVTNMDSGTVSVIAVSSAAQIV